MKRKLISGLVIIGGFYAAAAGAQDFRAAQIAPTNPVAGFSHPNTISADLAQLDLSLNNTGTLTGRFLQTGSDGRTASGTLYIQRPGKIRFDYDAPNPMLIVSDGITILQRDRALGTADRIPLKSTPLDFFLKNQIKLERDTKVLGLTKRAGETQVSVRDGSGKSAGEMTLIFNAQNLALKEWVVLDEFGTTTRIALSDLVYNKAMDPRLFVLEDRAARRRRE